MNEVAPNETISDWLELYNPSPTPIDISYWFLTDDKNSKKKYQFPGGSSVPANVYLLVYFIELFTRNQNTEFRLSSLFYVSLNSL